MNFLAHCALAQDASEQWAADESQRMGLLAGAVVGDFVRGTIPSTWPLPLQAGVKVHRRIDAFSNQDSLVQACSNRFPSQLRRFAPIFVDLIADHHLARDWQQHYPQRSLAEFAEQCYHAIESYESYLSTPGQRFFRYMREENLLLHYDQWEHVERGLLSVMRRLKRTEMAPEVLAVSRQVMPACQADCAALHQLLQDQWRTWKALPENTS